VVPAAPVRVPLCLRDVARWTLELLCFVGLPLCFAVLFAGQLADGLRAFDFQTFWQSGRDVLHGHSPYPDALPAVAQRTAFRPFVYPPVAAVLMAPFALLPQAIANVVWVVVGVGSIAGAMWLLDVRDWRCYGAVFGSSPVWSSLVQGAISSVLVLACAALWRFRSRRWVAGALLGGLVALKLYLWPLGVWLLATRRVQASLLGVVVAVTGVAASWAAIGFAGLGDYPQLIGRLSALVGDESYSPYALLRALGAPAGSSRLLILVFGGALLAAVVVHGRRPSGERPAYALAVGASLVLSPIVWPHYLTLLIVPLALARRRIAVAWTVPMTLWLVTPAWSDGNPVRIGALTAVVAGVLAWSALESRRAAAEVAA
jgi:hypothetical protein